MTTGKHVKYIIMKITCILLPVIFIFSSCESKNTEELPFLSVDSSVSDESSDTSAKTEITEIRVTVSPTASGKLINAANELCLKIEQALEIDTYMVYRAERELTESAVDIQLGYDSGEQAVNAMWNMRSKDYLCRDVGNGIIVMGGKSDGATIEAAERFCREILPSSTKYGIIPENGGFDFAGEYTAEAPSLNGVPLSEYKIFVENTSRIDIMETALFLQERLMEYTEVWLNIVSSAEETEGVGIYLNEEGKTGEACVVPFYGGILLRAASADGIKRASEKFLDCILEMSDTERVDYEIEEEITIFCGIDEFSVATVLLEKDTPFASAENFAIIMSEPITDKPDLLFTGRLEGVNATYIDANFKEYTVIKDTDGYTYGCAQKLSCDVIEIIEDDGLTVECYTVSAGTWSIALVRVSGKATKSNCSVNIPESVTALGSPVVAIVHVSNSEPVNINSQSLEKKHGEQYKLGTQNVTLDCYCDISEAEIDVSFEKGLSGYREIKVS